MPFALNAAAAVRVVRCLIRASAASGCLAAALMPAVFTNQFCNSAGNKPASSTPGTEHENAAEREPEFGLSGGDRLGDVHGNRLRLGFGFHLLSDAVLFHKLGKLHAGYAFGRIGNRLRADQCALNASTELNVGLGAACAYPHGHSDAGE